MNLDVRAESKKLEIVKQAFDRFYDGGFHATGVDTILAGSGISKRTLYKYFPTKDDLIEAVLDYYVQGIVGILFEPVRSSSDDPRDQIDSFFEIRKSMIDGQPNRGCLCIKAAQEFIGKHAGIASHGQQAALRIEEHFVHLCEQAGLARPAELGKQINLLFQGALLLSQVNGDSAPFVSARGAVDVLLKSAAGLDRPNAERSGG